MKIEKTEYSYHVTECDLKFGKQITLDGELLIPASVLDKIRAEIKEHADRLKDSLYGDGMRHCIDIIDKYKVESEGLK